MESKYLLIDYVAISYDDYEKMREEEVCTAYNSYYCKCQRLQEKPISFFEFEKEYKYSI